MSDESKYFEIIFDEDEPLKKIQTTPELDEYGGELPMKIEALDLTHFDTSQIISMFSMFNYCSYITELDLSNFDTSKVTNMTYMFSSCYNLKSLDLSHFDISKVTNMYNMFWNCRSLTSLDLTNWDLSNITDESNRRRMFEYCNSLRTIKINDEASANKLIAQIKTDLNKTATWDSTTKLITIPE